LGSSGSVVPIFLEQIQSGGPVTVTDPDMTRFIMPIEEAAELVLEANERMTSGEVFVLKMPAFRIGTLAEAMIEEYGPRFGYEPHNIEREIVGARPGERVHEKLISSDECSLARELENMYVILPQIDVSGYDQLNYSSTDQIENEYTSKDAELLSKDEIINSIDSVVSIQTGN
jgi:FlaA1/EpsC-like NDP-sugar epimerase